MAVILNVMLSPSEGVINMLLTSLGLIDTPIAFLAREDLYWVTVVLSSLWKNLGWSTIVYLAVISGIDQTLYESAKIDGAGRFARMWYIHCHRFPGYMYKFNFLLADDRYWFETSFFSVTV